MQQITLNAEVHFHEQEVVSIFHETNVADTEEQFAELVFAGAFAIRSMSNLGTDAVTDALGGQLQLVGQLIVETPEDLLTPKPKIVPYPGYAGRKRFISKLRLSSSQMRLGYSQEGFGWLATGLGYYCPNAVQSVFRYFADRRSKDDAYRSALANVAVGCGQLQLTRQIRLTNHTQLVMFLVATCMEGYLPEWMS